MDEENDSDDSEELWDDQNQKVQTPDKNGGDGENGTDDDNGWVIEEEEIVEQSTKLYWTLALKDNLRSIEIFSLLKINDRMVIVEWL